jgi:hypothetical protein
MASVLHLLGHNNPARALVVIEGQVAAGDTVTIAVVGPLTPALPPGVTAFRVPGDMSWDALLDVIFAADQVLSW